MALTEITPGTTIRTFEVTAICAFGVSLMQVENAWYIAAEPQELDSGVISRTILGKRLAIFKTGSGLVRAFDDRCPHRLAPLSLGKIVGENLRCAYHGAEFGADGRCVNVPGQSSAPAAASVRSYPVLERHGYVWVWLGDAANASDESTIPDGFAVSGDPKWIGGYGHFESIQVDYRLINDNLFDITHAEFVHPETFAGAELQFYRNSSAGSEFADRAMTYTIGSNSIQFRTRADNLGMEGAPFWREMMAQSHGVERWNLPVDFRMEVSWWAPSYWSFHITLRPCNEPDARPTELYNLHAAVPESATSANYFYRSVRNYGDASMNKTFTDGISFIFGQDKRILEGQQSVIGTEDLLELAPVSFRGDRLQIEARKILAKLSGKG